MNKLYTLFLIIFSCFLTGCLTIIGDYTPNVDVFVENSKKKYDVTYSVNYSSTMYEVDDDDRERCAEWIKDYLQQSEAFNSITYRDTSLKSKYHIDFYINYLGSPDTMGLSILAYFTFFILPFNSDHYYNVTAIVYLNNEPVYTPVTSERIRTWVWPPLLPVGLLWPPTYYARSRTKKQCLRYLINLIIENQRELAANPPKTKTTQSPSTKNASKATSTSTKSTQSKSTTTSIKSSSTNNTLEKTSSGTQNKVSSSSSTNAPLKNKKNQ